MSIAPADTKANAKALKKLLSQSRTLTRRIAHDAEYFGSGAGQSLHAYQQGQGSAGLKRKTQKLYQLLDQAEPLALPLGSALAGIVKHYCHVTRAIVRECDFFPRNSEWRGEPHMREQSHLLTDAREALRGWLK